MTLHAYTVNIDIDDNVPTGVLEDAIANAVRGVVNRKFFRVNVFASGGEVEPSRGIPPHILRSGETVFTKEQVHEIAEKLMKVTNTTTEPQGQNVKPPREHPFDGPEVFDDEMPADPFPPLNRLIDGIKAAKAARKA